MPGSRSRQGGRGIAVALSGADAMWLANALTLVRLPLALLFWAAVGRPAWAFAVLALAAASDVADGWVARRWRARHHVPFDQRSIGAWLDPLCDKTFVVSVLAATWWQVRPPLVVVAIIAARELVLLPMLLAFRLAPARLRVRFDFRAGRLGKAATVAQFVAVIALLADWWDGGVLAGLAGALGLAAAISYLERGLRLSRGERGLPLSAPPTRATRRPAPPAH